MPLNLSVDSGIESPLALNESVSSANTTLSHVSPTAAVQEKENASLFEVEPAVSMEDDFVSTSAVVKPVIKRVASTKLAVPGVIPSVNSPPRF